MKAIDTKAILLNYFVAVRQTYVPIKRLQKLLMHIYNELTKQNNFDEYEILFDISLSSIEEMVLRNNTLFDIDEDIIYLRERNWDNLSEEITLDEELKNIINSFVESICVVEGDLITKVNIINEATMHKGHLGTHRKKWINTGITYSEDCDDILYQCDNCKDAFFVHPSEIGYYNYCPRCGK